MLAGALLATAARRSLLRRERVDRPRIVALPLIFSPVSVPRNVICRMRSVICDPLSPPDTGMLWALANGLPDDSICRCTFH